MDDTQADHTKQEADQETEGTELQEGEAPAEDTGAIKCPKCTQVYGGPSSLKRHLWRIHRLSGDDAQALVDSAVGGTEEEVKEAAEEPQEEQPVDSDSSTGNKQIKPLLEIAPTVRPLLSLPPEPPGYQANNFGGISPTPPAWTGGSAAPAGLLPTPGCGDMMTHEQDYLSDPDEQQQQQQQPTESSTTEPGDGKIKPLMEVDLGKAGIPSLMSLPIMGQSPYMYSGGGMGGFYGRNNQNRRRERRSKPYNKNGHNNAGDENGGHNNAGREDAGGVVSCAECGEDFQDSADLTDHEINSHNVGIDLNCDVELTA